MLRYEEDDYVPEHWADGAACANTVASWRVRSGAHGPRLLIDLHNGWFFDSDLWRRCAGAAADGTPGGRQAANQGR